MGHDYIQDILQAGGTQVGRYKILEKLGKGGMGAVYKAYDSKLERTVALKAFYQKIGQDENSVKQFAQEAKANARLRHPHIVALYDFEQEGEFYFLTMDYIEGCSLYEMLKRRRLSYRRACTFSLQILGAIEYAHKQGIIHCDLKPGNILIDSNEDLFITDFGLAKAIAEPTQILDEDYIWGTPAYMAPEYVAQGVRFLDVQSDIYSIGAIFYEMLTGQYPFAEHESSQILQRLLTLQTPKKPSEIDLSIPLDLEEICLKAMAQQKDNRYRSAEEMTVAIEEYLLRHPDPSQQKTGRISSSLVLPQIGQVPPEAQEKKTPQALITAEMPVGINEYAQMKKTSKVPKSISKKDVLLQQLLLSMGIMDMPSLSKCFSVQADLRIQGIYKSLAEVVVEQRFATQECVDGLLLLRDQNGENLIPGYEVLEWTAEETSVVYLGRRIKDREIVSIKVFAPTISDISSTLARFMREAEITRQLDHPHIVKSSDFGVVYGVYYVVMEHVSGLSLAQIIARAGHMEEKRALKILEKLTQAMTYAWEKNIIHRDIRPCNIVSNGATLKICDLGLAKALEAGLEITEEGSPLGTPAFMSPEQFESLKGLDFRTDIYSLGVTFYNMLTGNLPFKETTRGELAHAHKFSKPVPPEKFNVVLSKQTRALLAKMLEKEKEKRAQTKTELLEDIRRVRSGRYPRKMDNKFSDLGALKKGPLVIGSISFLLLLLGMMFFWSSSESIAFVHFSPEHGETVFQPTLFLNGVIVCESLEHVRIGEQKVHLEAVSPKNHWRFNASLPLVEGKNRFSITGVTRTNFRKSYEYMVYREIVDRTPPVISIHEPSGAGPGKNMKFDTSTLFLKGEARDEHGVETVQVNQKAVFMKRGPESTLFQVSLELKEGPQIVAVTAKDRFHNVHEFSFIATYEKPAKKRRIMAIPHFFSIEAGETRQIEAKLYEENKEVKVEREKWHWKAEIGDCANGLYKAPSTPGIDILTLTHDQVIKPLLVKVRITAPKMKKTVRTALTQNQKGFFEKTFFNDHLMVWIPWKDAILPKKENGKEGFWMSKYEVSNEQYRRYLQAIGVQVHLALQKSMAMPEGYLTGPSYEEYPVVCVSWENAMGYCQWMQKNIDDPLLQSGSPTFSVRLPSMKEVVRAVGGNPAHYAWGSDMPDKALPYKANYDANYGVPDREDPSDGFHFTAPIYHYGGEPYNGGNGQSPYGIYNLSGNVSEWAWDDDPHVKQEKIVYGGSWKSRVETLKFDDISLESRALSFQMDTIGFRIVFIQE